MAAVESATFDAGHHAGQGPGQERSDGLPARRRDLDRADVGSDAATPFAGADDDPARTASRSTSAAERRTPRLRPALAQRAKAPRSRRRCEREGRVGAPTRCAEKFDLDFQLDDNEKPAPMRKREQPVLGRPRRRRVRSARRLVADAAGRGARARQARPRRSIRSARRSRIRRRRCSTASGTTRRPSSTSPRPTRRWATSKARARSCRKCCTRATTSRSPKRKSLLAKLG